MQLLNCVFYGSFSRPELLSFLLHIMTSSDDYSDATTPFTPSDSTQSFGFEESEMGEILCEPCLEEEPMVASNRCHVCEDEECLDRQKYGLNCQALVKACERQARKDGPDQQEAFKTIKRTGGATLKLCCLQFKAKCEAFAISNAGAGKYCTFDWVGFAQEHCVETSTSTETVLQWMTHGEYTHFIKVRDTLTDFQAEQRWH